MATKATTKKSGAVPKQVNEAKRLLTPEVKLERLYKKIATDPNFHHLRYKNNRFVGGVGEAKNPKIMIVLDIPEQTDAQTGIPMSGPAGAYLGDLLTSIELKRMHVFVTCIGKYRPYGGRDLTLAETAVSLTYLEQEIRITDPLFIMTAGRFVNSLFFNEQKYNDILWQWRKWKRRDVMPIAHPLAALKDTTIRPPMQEAFRIIGKEF